MVQLTYILFICILVPMTLMLFLLEPRARMTLSFMLVGMLTCLVAGEINAVISSIFSRSMLYMTVTYTPLAEEVLKGLSILYCSLFITSDTIRLTSNGMAVGIGFAIYENIGVILQESSALSMNVVLIRGFATALTHGICTSAVGFGLSFVRRRKKLAIPGTFGLLTLSVTYHAMFNVLIQSNYMIVASLLPLTTYIPVVTLWLISSKKKSKGKKIPPTG